MDFITVVFPLTQVFSPFWQKCTLLICFSRPCWLLLASPYLLQGSKQAQLFPKGKKKSLCRGEKVVLLWKHTASEHHTTSSYSFLLDEKVSVGFFPAHPVGISEFWGDELSRSVWSGGKLEKSCGNKMERTAESGLRRRRRRLAALETSAILPCYSLRRALHKLR